MDGTDNYKNGSAHSNGVKEATMDNIDVASLPLSNNEGGLSNQFSCLELQNGEHNGRVVDLSASKVKGELQKCLNGPVTVSTVLLPCGLINSGNLCVRNATLQALLSCSPFVQLLQELRTRKVPKSSSLNLTCLVVQVQRTNMQVFLRLIGLLALPCLKAFLKNLP